MQFKHVPLDDEDDKSAGEEAVSSASSVVINPVNRTASVTSTPIMTIAESDCGKRQDIATHNPDADPAFTPASRLYSDEDLKKGNNKAISMSMALHLKTLEVFFKLYQPEITTRQIALLKLLLEDLYRDFNITWETDVTRLMARDYPILSDLHKMAVEVRASNRLKNGSELQGIFKDDIFELEVMLREMSEGADSLIWNGHTTVDPKSRFICLDTHDLQDTSENVKKAQYYNLLTWMWQRMSRDRKEKAMLFADEAYLLIDPHVPQSSIYMRNMMKRARKYEAGLGVIFQSVVDVLDPSIKMYGQALLDMPAYKVLTGTDGVNVRPDRA